MTYGGETKRGCTEGFEWTLPDGTRIDEAAGGNGSLPACSLDPLFRVPPGTPITVEAPTASEVFATRTMTPFYEGRDGFGASVRWPGGGEGDFTVTSKSWGRRAIDTSILTARRRTGSRSRPRTDRGSSRVAPPTSGETWRASTKRT